MTKEQMIDRIIARIKDKHDCDSRVDIAIEILSKMYRDKKIDSVYYYFSLGLLYAQGYSGIVDFKQDLEMKQNFKKITSKGGQKKC